MRTFAVTGTDGKTTTAEFTGQLLRRSGRRSAVASTIGFSRRDGEATTISVAAGRDGFPRFMRGLRRQGVERLVLETHSTWLATGSYRGLGVEAAAFTSWGRDHLDAHGTSERYFQAKLRLFQEHLLEGGAALIPAALPGRDRVERACRDRGGRCWTFGREPHADLRLETMDRSGAESRATVRLLGQRYRCELPFAAPFMVENFLCAAGLAIADGVGPERVTALARDLKPPPGRMQRVECPGPGEVVVDFAHTPEGLTAALRALRPRTLGRLVVVFGCGGDRDRGKRPLMGAAACRWADRVIVTDDQPRSEDPAEIRAAVLRGCPDATEIPGRRAALRRALRDLRGGDLLLVAGMGHEAAATGSGRGTTTDRAVLEELAVGA